MTDLMKAIALSLSLFAALSANAQQMKSFERILLPITVRNVPGAFGSVWDTNIWARITATSDSFAIEPFFFLLQDCEPPCTGHGGLGPIEADFAYPIDFYHTHTGETPGQLMYVTSPDVDDVHLSIRLSNGMPGATPVELPVVRERDFTSRTLQILGVPTAVTSPRALLRIYGVDPEHLGSVHVKAFQEDLGVNMNRVVLDIHTSLAVTQKYDTSNGVALAVRPPVAELNLTGLIPSDAPEIRLEVTPDDPSLKLWAFVSLTDNITQQVTLRLPN